MQSSICIGMLMNDYLVYQFGYIALSIFSVFYVDLLKFKPPNDLIIYNLND